LWSGIDRQSPETVTPLESCEDCAAGRVGELQKPTDLGRPNAGGRLRRRHSMFVGIGPSFFR